MEGSDEERSDGKGGEDTRDEGFGSGQGIDGRSDTQLSDDILSDNEKSDREEVSRKL